MSINNTDSVIDSRDVIDRIEELQTERDEFVIGAPDGTETPAPEQWAEENPDDAEELEKLEALAGQCEGYGDWRHGETLIHADHFEAYAQELAEDIGAIDRNATWPLAHIDWEAAANALKIDYMEVDFDGETYFMRA